MSDMSYGESLERYKESLKKAASRARELALAQKDSKWISIANSLDGLLAQGTAMALSYSLSKTQVESDIKTYIDRAL